ncbi:hypothetical protein N9933_03395, partial [bacterium]|nr:hypothetical protein [bacterium]
LQVLSSPFNHFTMKSMLNFKKLFLLSGLLLLLSSFVFSQVPVGMNYQAVVRDGQQVLANQLMGVEFSVYQDLTEVYKESQILTSNEFGLIHAIVGEGNTLSGKIDSIDWSSGSYKLKVSIDAGGGFEDLGEMTLTSVPYSRLAERVANLDNLDLSDLSDVGAATPTQDQVLVWDGSKWMPGEGSPWEKNGTEIFYLGGNVGINTASPTNELTVRGDIDVLDLTAGFRGARVYGWGGLGTWGDNGQRNALLTYRSGYRNHGALGLYDSSGVNKVFLQVAPVGCGALSLFGNNGNEMLAFGFTGTDGNNGYIAARDAGGTTRANLYASTSGNGTGISITYGPNGNRNTSMSWLTNYNNNGYIAVRDASNTNQAGLYVNASGDGIVFGDVKNFRMDHPTQPGKEIWYASIEGPEAAAYERGTAKLVHGKANVDFSDHFKIVSSTTGMTVILTPLSGASEGLAVIKKGETGFEVVELRNGTGTYEFDWEVKVIRKGYEDYRVIRDAIEARSGDEDEILEEIENQ